MVPRSNVASIVCRSENILESEVKEEKSTSIQTVLREIRNLQVSINVT
jgi:hypothetical protein